IMVMLWPVRKSEFPKSGAELQLSEWMAPTDFLLATPGQELLDRVPEIPSVRALEVLELLPDGSQGKKRRKRGSAVSYFCSRCPLHSVLSNLKTTRSQGTFFP